MKHKRYQRANGPPGKIGTFDPLPSAKFAARALGESGTQGALIGRLAVWAWLDDESEHAYTKDLDIAITAESSPKVFHWLNEDDTLEVQSLPIGGANARDTQLQINVDFIHRQGDLGDLSGLFGASVQAALESGLVWDFDEGQLPIVPPEHLVLMKVATGERKDEQDAARLLAHVEDLDVELMRRLARDLLGPGVIGRLEVLLREAHHPHAHPRRRS